MKDEMDILKEIGTTAAAHGSIALSEMLGRRLYMPNIEMIHGEDLEKTFKINKDEIVISLQMQILSGLRGKILFILDEKGAYKLIDICYKMEDENIKKSSVFTEVGFSLIKEVGNIVTSAYVNTLGFYLKKLIIPSLPVFINAPIKEIIKTLTISYSKEDYILVIETVFEEVKERIKGTFWLVLTPEAEEEIKEACKKMLEDFEK
jgi:chemotaxis protein CheC